jgi:hypothetical protein
MEHDTPFDDLRPEEGRMLASSHRWHWNSTDDLRRKGKGALKRCAMGQAFAGPRVFLDRVMASVPTPWLEPRVYTEESEQKKTFRFFLPAPRADLAAVSSALMCVFRPVHDDPSLIHEIATIIDATSLLGSAFPCSACTGKGAVSTARGDIRRHQCVQPPYQGSYHETECLCHPTRGLKGDDNDMNSSWPVKLARSADVPQRLTMVTNLRLMTRSTNEQFTQDLATDARLPCWNRL